ncbi:Ig-like domain-containing protein [Elusimicrobiota bacterium]
MSNTKQKLNILRTAILAVLITAGSSLTVLAEPLPDPVDVESVWGGTYSNKLDRVVSWEMLEDEAVKAYHVYVKYPDSSEYVMEMEVPADLYGYDWISIGNGDYKMISAPTSREGYQMIAATQNDNKFQYLYRKDSEVHPVGKYSFYICAVDADGAEGPSSEVEYCTYAGLIDVKSFEGDPLVVSWSGPLDSTPGLVRIDILKDSKIVGSPVWTYDSVASEAVIDNSALEPGNTYYIMITKRIAESPDNIEGETYSRSLIDEPFYLSLPEPEDNEAPGVSITVTPQEVMPGEDVTVTVTGTDDLDLAAIWWWGENTPYADLNKAHWHSCSGTEETHVWTINTAGFPVGDYTLGANARDAAYPVPGEPHQASEGAGIKYAGFTVKDKTTIDLKIVDVSCIPDKLVAGEDTKIEIPVYFKCEGERDIYTDVNNNGKYDSGIDEWYGAARIKDDFKVEVRINGKPFRNAVLTYDPMLAGTGWRVKFGEGGSKSFTPDFYEACVPGENEIYVKVDAGNQVSEKYENNNEMTVKVHVEDIVPPDIAVENLRNDEEIKNEITISAEADDNTRVDRVEFYVGSIKIKTIKGPPYKCKWETHLVENGEHQIRVIASDIFGNTSIKSIKVKVKNKKPKAWNTVPQKNNRVKGDAVTVMAEVDGGTSKVHFQYKRKPNGDESVQWKTISKDDEAPYSCYWNTDAIDDGEYILRAVAYDEYGYCDSDPDIITIFVDGNNWDIYEEGNPDVNPGVTHKKREKFSKEDGGTISLADGTQAVIPPGIDVGARCIDISILNPEDMVTTLPPVESSLKSVGIFREYNFSDGSRIFNKKITLVLPYKDKNKDGIIDGTDVRVEDLRPYWFNEKEKIWIPVGESQACFKYSKRSSRKKGNFVEVKVDHFTIFALMAHSPNKDLKDVLVYPNPYKPNSGLDHQNISFDGLTEKAVVRIYTITGRLVNELKGHTIPGKIEWDVLNSDYERVASGVYLYVITDGDNKSVIGKFAVIR